MRVDIKGGVREWPEVYFFPEIIILSGDGRRAKVETGYNEMEQSAQCRNLRHRGGWSGGLSAGPCTADERGPRYWPVYFYALHGGHEGGDHIRLIP